MFYAENCKIICLGQHFLVFRVTDPPRKFLQLLKKKNEFLIWQYSIPWTFSKLLGQNQTSNKEVMAQIVDRSNKVFSRSSNLDFTRLNQCNIFEVRVYKTMLFTVISRLIEASWMKRRNSTPTSRRWQLCIGYGLWSILPKRRSYASTWLHVTRSFALFQF